MNQNPQKKFFHKLIIDRLFGQFNIVHSGRNCEESRRLRNRNPTQIGHFRILNCEWNVELIFVLIILQHERVRLSGKDMLRKCEKLKGIVKVFV